MSTGRRGDRKGLLCDSSGEGFQRVLVKFWSFKIVPVFLHVLELKRTNPEVIFSIYALLWDRRDLSP